MTHIILLIVVRQHTAPLKINRAKQDMWENAYIYFLVHLIEDGIWILEYRKTAE